jgi:ligand-binding SRPBCC domain-containing protein
MVWPYHASEAGAQESAAPAPRNTVRPHHADHAAAQEETAAPWNMVWPYHAGAQEPVARAASGVALAAAGVTAAAGIALAAVGVARATAEQRRDSPAPWNMVWPYHAAGSSSGQLSVAPAAVYPHLNICAFAEIQTCRL